MFMRLILGMYICYSFNLIIYQKYLFEARDKLRYTGVTTIHKCRKYVEKDSAFRKHFQQVMVNESSSADFVSIEDDFKDCYELHFRGMTNFLYFSTFI